MAQTTIEVDSDDVKNRTADDRGRVRLGPDLAGKEVEVAILDVEGDDDDEQATNRR